ncbi:hypothetical protein NQZ68_001586 [Dissostichus eleginoides]|nr:hypothetical protein NQZ68_001586 [Dissostichus eleginoides]
MRPGHRATSPPAWSQYLNRREGTLGSGRLLVHRSTASTHGAKEQSSHYQPYLIPTLPRLTDTQGQTVAGPGRSALLGDSKADTEADWEVH